jgi:hypothetical protein
MSKEIIAVLGASDPEMQEIENLLKSVGIPVMYATAGGKRCHPGNAYKADPLDLGSLNEVPKEAWLVECQPQFVVDTSCRTSEMPEDIPTVVVDHHRPGDPGYGAEPKEFLKGSSLGQVISLLGQRELLPTFYRDPRSPAKGGWSWVGGSPCSQDTEAGEIRFYSWDNRWEVLNSPPYEGGQDLGGNPIHCCSWARIPKELVMAAAADHCLHAAYKGECPGVNPEALMEWRAKGRAKFQGKSLEEILGAVENARRLLKEAREEGIVIPAFFGDPVPELPEASAREGIPFTAEIKDRDGRMKEVLQGADHATIVAWMDARKAEGREVYGNPVRGFAGAYK